MDSITFCIPHHSTTQEHVFMLLKCIQSILNHYPTNPILLCRTSSSLPIPVQLPPNVTVYNTALDGTHVIGAMDCLLKNCKTDKYILLHDSMFLLKRLPESILEKKLYGLWYFFKNPQDLTPELLNRYLACSNFTDKESSEIRTLFTEGVDTKWRSIFGPAFGGTIERLKELTTKMNITDTTLSNFVGRDSLMACERYIPLIAIYTDLLDPIDQTWSLNGDISKHSTNIPTTIYSPFEVLQMAWGHSYFAKFWLGRP